MNTITINGLDIRYTKKKIKNFYIRVLSPEAEVVVSVPLHTSDAKLRSFLTEHWEWIEEKVKEVKEREPEEKKEFVSGETHLLFGKPYILQVKPSMQPPLTEMREGVIVMRVKPRSTVEERRKQLDKWYRLQLEKVLPDMIKRCQERVGKEATTWQFRRVKTRWGSCNIQKKKIMLNIQLAEKPLCCLEYVVTHELNHLHEAGHTKRFWKLMDEFYPDWKKVRKMLNG